MSLIGMREHLGTLGQVLAFLLVVVIAPGKKVGKDRLLVLSGLIHISFR